MLWFLTSYYVGFRHTLRAETRLALELFDLGCSNLSVGLHARCQSGVWRVEGTMSISTVHLGYLQSALSDVIQPLGFFSISMRYENLPPSSGPTNRPRGLVNAILQFISHDTKIGRASLGAHQKLSVLLFECLTVAIEGCARQLFANSSALPRGLRSLKASKAARSLDFLTS